MPPLGREQERGGGERDCTEQFILYKVLIVMFRDNALSIVSTNCYKHTQYGTFIFFPLQILYFLPVLPPPGLCHFLPHESDHYSYKIPYP